MKYTTPYKVLSGDVSSENDNIQSGEVSFNTEEILSGNTNTETYKWSNYDDTKIKERISLLEREVNDLERNDEGFNRRLTLIEGSYAKRDEVQLLERRVSRLENDPVGLNNEQMDNIFD